MRTRPITDGESVKVRAANFFALQSLWKNPSELNGVWDELLKQVDVSRPLSYDAAAWINRFDVDGARLDELYAMVRKSFERLQYRDRILEWRTPSYPQRLSELEDAPRFLFVRSEEALLDAPSISVVGTRKPTDEGRRRARKLAYLLAKRKITVVSGLARGIDEAAHRGAVDVGGRTIAVIGTPLNRVYPREHEDLQRHIGRVGAVVSQFYPGSATTPLSFPLRNATMSGLTLGTVIVEASETSGTHTQAEHCLAHGRKLFIPRSAVENGALKWPKKYLERGAIMFSAVEELVEILEHEGLLPAATESDLGMAEVLKFNVAGG